MAEQYFLYTVTGLREPFYAAVDHETGRAWTAPTKDGAVRQARDFGITDFLEKTITREKFLRSLGIEAEVTRPIHRDPPPRRDPDTKPPKPAPHNSFFMPGDEAVDDNSHGKGTSIPERLRHNKTKAPGGGSPFAGHPISAPSEDAIPDSDDLLIIPSDHSTPAAPTPFTDTPTRVPDEVDE